MAENIDDKIIDLGGLRHFKDNMDNSAKISSNPNLLINPDFRINQRGKTTYTGPVYSIDHWLITTNGTVTVNPNSITISAENGRSFLEQAVLERTVVSGKTITASAVCADGTMTSGSGECPAQKGTERAIFINVPIADTGCNMRIYRASQNDNFDILYQIEIAEGTSVELSFGKLETGSAATPFVSPDPAAELVKCQRYYQICRDVRSCYTFSSQHGCFFAFQLKTEMRTLPTVIVPDITTGTKLCGTEKQGVYTSGWTFGENTKALGCDLFQVNLKNTDTSLYNTEVWYQGFSFPIALDAEIYGKEE